MPIAGRNIQAACQVPEDIYFNTWHTAKNYDKIHQQPLFFLWHAAKNYTSNDNRHAVRVTILLVGTLLEI
jgi:hypothetical protein